jgi:hypothetical protein
MWIPTEIQTVDWARWALCWAGLSVDQVESRLDSVQTELRVGWSECGLGTEWAELNLG